jgi:hypothetical protein
MSRMPVNHKSPVFCDNCPGFAMAELEGVVLCTGCLMRALLSSDDAELFEKVKPLESVPPISPVPRSTEPPAP